MAVCPPTGPHAGTNIITARVSLSSRGGRVFCSLHVSLVNRRSTWQAGLHGVLKHHFIVVSSVSRSLVCFCRSPTWNKSNLDLLSLQKGLYFYFCFVCFCCQNSCDCVSLASGNRWDTYVDEISNRIIERIISRIIDLRVEQPCLLASSPLVYSAPSTSGCRVSDGPWRQRVH